MQDQDGQNNNIAVIELVYDTLHVFLSMQFNFDILQADHVIRKFILNPVEGSRSDPTRNLNLQLSVIG